MTRTLPNLRLPISSGYVPSCIIPVRRAGDGYVFVVVVDPARDSEPREESDDGAAAEEHCADDDDERRRQDHLAGVRQRVPDREREGDGAPGIVEVKISC